MVKKAVITTGGKQYFVSEGETLSVELLKTDKKKIDFKPLLVIDNDAVSIGQPTIDTTAVSAEIVEQEEKQDKVTSIRYKSKKRVRKVRGHRQRLTKIKIDSIKSK